MRSFATITILAIAVVTICVVSVGCDSGPDQKPTPVKPLQTEPTLSPADNFEISLAEINTFAARHGLEGLSEEEIEAIRKARPPVRRILDVASVELESPMLQPGQKWSQRVKFMSQMILPAGMGSNNFNTESNMVLDYHVLAVDADGVILEISIAGVNASATLMGYKQSFDHTSDTAAAIKDTPRLPRGQRYKNAFAGLVGSKYSARLDRAGNFVELLDIDARLMEIADATVAQHEGTEQTTMLLSRGALGDYAGLAMFDAGLTDTLSKDASWSTPGTAKAPRIAQANTIRTHKVKNFEEVDDVKLVNITYRIAGKATSEPAVKGRKRRGSYSLTVLGVRGVGEIVYSLSEARITKQVEKMNIEVSPGGSTRGPAGKKPAKRRNRIFYRTNRFIELIEEE